MALRGSTFGLLAGIQSTGDFIVALLAAARLRRWL